MNRLFHLSILIILVGLSFFSCENNEKIKNNVKMEKLVWDLNLFHLQKENLNAADSIIKSINKRKKIISIIDGICMKCVVYDLNETDKHLQKITNNNTLAQVVYILNVNNTDSIYFLKNLQPHINVKGIILWDNAFKFEKTNQLLTSDKNKRTILVDENNFIKIKGNPFTIKSINKQYIEELTKN
jgi:hypothetical protein